MVSQVNNINSQILHGSVNTLLIRSNRPCNSGMVALIVGITAILLRVSGFFVMRRR